MPVPESLQPVLQPELLDVLNRADATGDFAQVEARLEAARAHDLHMAPYQADEAGSKYYKPFVQTAVQKIIPRLRNALAAGHSPEIEISYEEINRTRNQLGIPAFGSPQDVLYGFTSERYPDWGPTLETIGFQSACMIGTARAVISMAPRYLSAENPGRTIQELEGAITRDSWQSMQVVFSQPDRRSLKEKLLELAGFFTKIRSPLVLPDFANVDETTAAAIRDALMGKLEGDWINLPARRIADSALVELEALCAIPSIVTRRRKTAAMLGATESQFKTSQEQIALKYVEEGKFLQKLLGGARVEHIQSNVKMVKNPMRGNKCEVDSIYRVVGEKRIVLVEAKDKPQISRAQLYSIYETYRLKLPLSWELDVVAVLLSRPTLEQVATGTTTLIDLVQVGFDQNSIGRITESLIGVTPNLHYRWQIMRQTEH